MILNLNLSLRLIILIYTIYFKFFNKKTTVRYISLARRRHTTKNQYLIKSELQKIDYLTTTKTTKY
jgi:hypothetical protein